MLTVALKGLAGRKVRALLTAIAIILGVAMISGTYILTDTINSGFNTIFSRSYQNADVVISGKGAFDSANGTSVEPPPMPQSLLAKVQKLPGVALAAGSVTTDTLKLIGKDGKVISTGGAPSLGFSVTNAPTKSATPAKASNMYRRNEMKPPACVSLSFFACAVPVRTTSVDERSGLICERSSGGLTPAFD